MINHEVDGTDKSDRWRPVDLNLLRFVGHRDGSDPTTIVGVSIASLKCNRLLILFIPLYFGCKH